MIALNFGSLTFSAACEAESHFTTQNAYLQFFNTQTIRRAKLPRAGEGIVPLDVEIGEAALLALSR
jgi:hypothetical protein